MNQDGVELLEVYQIFEVDVERIMGQKTDCINQPLENIFEQNLIHCNRLLFSIGKIMKQKKLHYYGPNSDCR